MGRVTKYMVLVCALLCGFAAVGRAQSMSLERLAPVYDTIPVTYDIAFDKPLTFMKEPADNFSHWCGANIDYPDEALKNNITGKVIVQFIITTEGKVSDVKVIKGAHPLLDAEAVRVVSSSPAWEPVTLNGRKVNVEFVQPVVFRITKKTDNDGPLVHARFSHNGDNNFMTWIARNIRYPKEAMRVGAEGDVYLAFSISEEGYVDDVKILRGVSFGKKEKRAAAAALNEEALRVVSASPRWIPAMKWGKPVKISYNVQISFSRD